MRSNALYGLIILALAASGCAEEETCSTGGAFTIPTIEVECATADQAVDCEVPSPPAADGKSAWVIIGPTSMICEDFLFTDPYSAKTEIASITCSGSSCSGTTSGLTWTDSSGATVTSLSGGTYRFCVWIDTDGGDDIAPDAGEARSVADEPVDSCGRSIVMTGFFDG